MAAVGYFWCPKFTFDRISGHFRSIQIYFFPLQNGHRRTFWTFENHFWLHFWPFQIDRPFGCLKFTFDSNSGHFRSIQNFFFSAAILDVQKSIGQIDRPFWMSEIHFRWHFWPFQIHTVYLFLFLTKWPPAGILEWDDSVNYWTRPRYLDE